MNNEIKIFNSDRFGAIRTAGDAENPMFCLADLCKVLELQVTPTKNRLKQKGVTLINTLTKGGEQQLLFVNEQNLYRVIMRSDKPQAEAFQDWVCGEVLPTIRKTGGYISASSDETPEQIMARALKVADETLKRREQQLQMAQSQIEEQRKEIQDLNPYADYTKEVLQSDSTYTLTQVSKDLGFKSVYAFLEWAKEKDYLFRQSNMWMPTSRVSGRGFFTTRTAKYFKSDGSVGSSLSTVVTERGRAFLHTSLNEH